MDENFNYILSLEQEEEEDDDDNDNKNNVIKFRFKEEELPNERKVLHFGYIMKKCIYLLMFLFDLVIIRFRVLLESLSILIHQQ